MTQVDFWRIVCLVWSFLEKKMTKTHASNESKWCNHDSSWFRWLAGCIQAKQSESSKFQCLVQEVSLCVNYLYSIKLLCIYIYNYTILKYCIPIPICYCVCWLLLFYITQFVWFIHHLPEFFMSHPVLSIILKGTNCESSASTISTCSTEGFRVRKSAKKTRRLKHFTNPDATLKKPNNFMSYSFLHFFCILNNHTLGGSHFFGHSALGKQVFISMYWFI